MKIAVRDITLSGLVIGLGIGIPWAFHLVGAGHLGSLFLPMFWPVVAGAFYLPVSLGVLAAVATPLLSALLTGMPPFAPPIAFLMAAELVAMTATIDLLRRLRVANPWIMLAVAVAVDRAILALCAAGLSSAFGLPPWLVTWGSLLAGLPGIVVLFGVVPPLVRRLGERTQGNRGIVQAEKR